MKQIIIKPATGMGQLYKDASPEAQQLARQNWEFFGHIAQHGIISGNEKDATGVLAVQLGRITKKISAQAKIIKETNNQKIAWKAEKARRVLMEEAQPLKDEIAKLKEPFKEPKDQKVLAVKSTLVDMLDSVQHFTGMPVAPLVGFTEERQAGMDAIESMSQARRHIVSVIL